MFLCWHKQIKEKKNIYPYLFQSSKIQYRSITSWPRDHESAILILSNAITLEWLNHKNNYKLYVILNSEILFKYRKKINITSTILPLGRPPPRAKSSVKQPLGKVSLQKSQGSLILQTRI